MKNENIIKIKIKCFNCGKIFYVYPYRKDTARYCSRKCLNNSKIGITKTFFKKVKCLSCAEFFKVSINNKDQSTRKYCSLKCYRQKRSSGYYQNHRKCIYCGNLYYKGRQKAKFCSRRCFHKWSVGKLTVWNKSLKGIHLSPKSEFRPGEKHIFWQGGISKEPYPFEFTDDLKLYIKHIYLCRCQMCETSKDLMVHHIDYDKKNIYLNNLIPLCRRCHSKTNYNRNHWIEFLRKKVVFNKNILPNKIEYSFTKPFIKSVKID